MNKSNSINRRQVAINRNGARQNGFVSLAVLLGVAAIVAVLGVTAAVIVQQVSNKEVQLKAIDAGKNAEAQAAFSVTTDQNGVKVTTVGGCTVTEPAWGTVDCTSPLQGAFDNDEFNDQTLIDLLGNQVMEDLQQGNFSDVIGLPITFDSAGVIPEADGSIVELTDIATVPEPSIVLLFAFGLGGIAASKLRHGKHMKKV